MKLTRPDSDMSYIISMHAMYYPKTLEGINYVLTGRHDEGLLLISKAERG